MKNLSKFDLGIIIAFVVLGLLGGGAWYYLSGRLADAQQNAATAKAEFDKNSSSGEIAVSQSNAKILQDDIDLLRAQLDPLVKTKLRPTEDKVLYVEKKDPVAWRHELDDEVGRLTAAAKAHGVKLPPNFYFAFSRYLNRSPEDEQTVVLSKQLLGIDQIATILINAPVKRIASIRRSYEEEPHGGNTPPASLGTPDTDRMGGYAVNAGGNTYTVYPFEIEFQTSMEGLRKVVDDLVQSPYVLVIRSISVQNTVPSSPQLTDLDKIAGTDSGSSSVVGTSPGEVAATTSTQGPQFLFGNSPLNIKMRIDMIEWHDSPSTTAGK